MLSGKYTTAGEEAVQVTYKVPFHSIKNQEGVEVAIQPNHRYTVTVNDADPYKVELSIRVADWEEGEDLDDYDPDKANGIHFQSINLTDDISNSVSFNMHTIQTTSDGTKGTLVFKSNSAMKVNIAYAGGDMDHQWISFDPPTEKDITEVGWSKEYTFTPKVTHQTEWKYPPATLTFTNATGAVKVIYLHSRQMYSAVNTSQTAQVLDNGSKRYLVVKSDLVDSNTNWNVAMTKCRAEDGWRLPTMNDLRQMIKMYGWDTTPYLKPGGIGSDYWTAFNNKPYTHTTGLINKDQFGQSTAINNNNLFNYDFSYWTSDTSPIAGTDAGYMRSNTSSKVIFGFAGKNASYRVRCIKDWNKY